MNAVGEGLLTINLGKEFQIGMTSIKKEWRWERVETNGWKRILLWGWRGDGEGWFVNDVWGMQEWLFNSTLSLMFLLRVFRGDQFNVDCSSAMSKVQFFVTILPANFWTPSRLAMSCLWWGSHTAEQYSNFGRIVVFMNFRRTSAGAWWSCLWIKPMCLFADLQVKLICSDQVNFGDRMTPRYLMEGLGKISCPSTLRWVGIGCLDLVTVSSLVFVWFGVSPCDEIFLILVSCPDPTPRGSGVRNGNKEIRKWGNGETRKW